MFKKDNKKKDIKKPASKTKVTKDKDNISKDAVNQYESHMYKLGALPEIHKRLNSVIILVVIASIITILGGINNATIKPENSYIPVDNNYTVQYGIPNDKQFASKDIENFTKNAILNTFSFNYLNYQEKINDLYNTYYTQSGAQALDKVLNQRDIFKFLNSKTLMIVDSDLKSNPLIIKQGMSSNNTPAWVVDVDIELVLVTAQRERRDTYTYRVIIERMPAEQRQSQLGIVSIQQR